MMILRDFIYLNEAKLDQYLSQVEGGLRSSSSTSTRQGTGGGGRLNVQIASAELTGSSQTEETTARVDTPGSKFDRLMSLVEHHREEVNWVEVLSGADLVGAAPRQILELDLELAGAADFDILKPGGLIDSISALTGLASALGTAGMQNMPSADQMEALKLMGQQMDGRLMRGVSLADDETTVFGMLGQEASPRALEGEARVVGKITRVLSAGEWALPPNLPMYSNLPRDQRRKMAAAGPKPGQEKWWVQGPAVELDVLAIWN